MTDENGFTRNACRERQGGLLGRSRRCPRHLPSGLSSQTSSALPLWVRCSARPGNRRTSPDRSRRPPTLLTSDSLLSASSARTTCAGSPRAFGFCCAHILPGSAVSLGFPPGGQRLRRAGPYPGPSQPIQRLRKARGGPRDLPWRRASRQGRRRLSPPVLPILRASGSGNSNNPTARATASPQPRTMAGLSPPASMGTRRAGYWEW